MQEGVLYIWQGRFGWISVRRASSFSPSFAFFFAFPFCVSFYYSLGVCRVPLFLVLYILLFSRRSVSDGFLLYDAHFFWAYCTLLAALASHMARRILDSAWTYAGDRQALI